MRNIQPPEYSGLDSNREALDWMARGDAFYARYARWLYVVDGKLNAVFFVFFFFGGFLPTENFYLFSVGFPLPKTDRNRESTRCCSVVFFSVPHHKLITPRYSYETSGTD